MTSFWHLLSPFTHIDYIFRLFRKQKSCSALKILSNSIQHSVVWSRCQILKKWWRHFDTFCHLLLTLSTFSDFFVSKKVVQHKKSFPTVYDMPIFEEIENSNFWKSAILKFPPLWKMPKVWKVALNSFSLLGT